MPNACGNGFGHFAGTVPHGVVKKSDLVLLIIFGPLQIFFDDLHGIVPPQYSVARANHLQRQIETGKLLNLFQNQWAERSEDIGVIFDTFGPEFARIDLVVIEVFGCQMLPESIIGKQNVLTG